MKYIKLYESFTLPKYENDYKKVISYKEEIKKKESELWDMKTILNQMEMKLNKDHNLSKILQHILEKVKNFHNIGEDDDILNYLPESQKILGNGINMIYIDIYDSSVEDHISELIDEIVYDGDEWVFKNYDNYGDEIYTKFNDLDTDILYKIIKVLMNDPIVITSMNTKSFKNINR